MISNRNFTIEDCLITEMAPSAPAYFDPEGNMRSTQKYKLRETLAVTIPQRQVKKCDIIVYDVSALLWSISWPKEGSPLQTYIKAFQVFVLTVLATCNVVLVYDRYFQNSTKAHERLQRQGTEGMSRVHVLTPDTLSLPRACILRVTENKQQMNVMH